MSGIKERNLIGYIFKLSHIARPPVMKEHLLSLFIKSYLRSAVAFSKISSKLTRQQSYVITSVTQRRNGDVNC